MFTAVFNMQVPIFPAGFNSHIIRRVKKKSSKHQQLWDCVQTIQWNVMIKSVIIEKCLGEMQQSKLLQGWRYLYLRILYSAQVQHKSYCLCVSKKFSSCWDHLHSPEHGTFLKSPFQPDKFKQSNFRPSCTCSMDVPPLNCLAGRQSFV